MDAAHSSRAEMRHFTTITSPFYPQLEQHYEPVFDDWVAAGREQQTAE